MRILYAGLYAVGEDASFVRAHGVAAALRQAGFELVPVPAPSAGPNPSVATRLRQRYLYDLELADLIEDTKPDLVIAFHRLGWLRAALRHRLPVINDLQDWYDWRHVPPSSLPQWTINEFAVRYGARRVRGALVASRMLADHYTNRGVPSMVIPAVFDPVPQPGSERAAAGRFRIAYVGAIASKDALAVRNIVRVMARLDPAGRCYEAHIAGGEIAQIREICGIELPASVHVHGRLEHQAALDLLSSCDVSLIQRDPKRRYARAGFPTKVAESLLLGVPVMGNLSSDLSDHLVDGSNAIVLGGHDEDSLERGLLRAARGVSFWPRARIADQALARYRPAAYAGALRRFIEAVV